MDQMILMITGVVAVFLSQVKSNQWTRWACLFGLASQPFWFYTLWPDRSRQWGAVVLCLLYTGAWVYGLWNHWVRVPRRGEREVYDFAEAIIETLSLPKNAGKGGWEHIPSGDLMLRLYEEADELHEAVGGNGNPSAEATDVGAFAMMIYHRSLKNIDILY